MYSFKIRELFIFNTNLKSPKKKPSDDEAQDAKLLYYYPDNTEILVKRSNIGIIEGTLSFMQAFEKVDSNFLLTELDKTVFIAEGYENDPYTDLISSYDTTLTGKAIWAKAQEVGYDFMGDESMETQLKTFLGVTE